MDAHKFKDEYTSILKLFVESQQEQYLAEAAQLGRELVLANVPPEEIAEIHEDAVKALAEEFPDKTLLESASRISAPLMEMLMAYGLAFREWFDKRKQAEDNLRESEQKYRALVEQSLQGIIILQDFQIIFANSTAAKIAGLTVDEVLTLSPEDIKAFIPIEEQAAILQRYEERLADKVVEHNYELCLMRQDGDEFWLDVFVSSIECLGKSAIQVAFIDITESKKAEDALRADRAKLKAMASEVLRTEERERQRIAVGIHDEICQKLVLTKFTLESSLLLVSNSNVLASVEVACETIGEMIEQSESLTFALSNPVLRELGLVTALKRHLAKELQERHGIAFELEDDQKLSIASEQIKSCLFRVSRELLMNVVKHAHARKVKVSVGKNRNRIRISIQDDGVGFKDAQANSEVSRTSRFGLLSVREQLEYMGGHLKIESERGRGATVTVVVPLQEKPTV